MKIEPLRFYLKTGDKFRKLFWFNQTKPNEMRMNVNGLKKPNGFLSYKFKEVKCRISELSNLHYSWKEKINVGEHIDHISCHESGEIHLVTKNGKDHYIQSAKHYTLLGPDAPVFFEFIAITDLVKNYPALNNIPKKPYLSLEVLPTQSLYIRGFFSGKNFDILSHVANILVPMQNSLGHIIPTLSFSSGSFNGIIFGVPQQLSLDALNSKLEGTIFSFKINTEKDHCVLKTMMFC